MCVLLSWCWSCFSRDGKRVKSLRSCAPDFITRRRECFGSDELRLIVNEGNSGCMKKYAKRPEINVSRVMGRKFKV